MSSNSNEIKDIETLLSNYLKPSTKILKQDIKTLTAPGENYGSIMQAVDITIQEPNKPQEILHLVAKRRPANELLCEMFNIQQTFKKEMSVYLQIIPALEKFDAEYGNSTCEVGEMFAKCYGARINLNPDSDFVDDDAVICLQNLKSIGYEVEDRLKGFDEEQVYLLLNDLAKLHAVPIAFKIKDPEEFQNKIAQYLKGIKIDDGFDEKAKEIAINEILDHVKDVDECKPHLDKIKNCIESCLNGYGLLDPPKEPFATMIHTDFWVNNTMLFKDGSGKSIKNKIVDLQLPIYNSSVRDILFLLYSSVQPEVLYANLDAFLKFYHEKFISYLNVYNVEIGSFSWDSFKDELKYSGFTELGHILIMYKAILAKRGMIDDMANFTLDTILKSDIVSSDYGDRIRRCVLSFIRNEWI